MSQYGQRPTPQEISLVRQIWAHLGAEGWRYREPVVTWEHPDGRSLTWETSGDDYSPQLGFTRATDSPAGWYWRMNWVNVETVTEAVDILVALGHLPARFSSAYRAGWDARTESTDGYGHLSVFVAPDVEPAVGL